MWAALGILVEMVGPVIAERGKGGTPWHAHHIAERYGLLTIITLGEGVIGTVASLSAVVESQGWSRDAVLVAIAGTRLTFGMWWMYFIIPSAEVLHVHVHRERAFPWGYGHILIFGSIAANGAGLHVAADYMDTRRTSAPPRPCSRWRSLWRCSCWHGRRAGAHRSPRRCRRGDGGLPRRHHGRATRHGGRLRDHRAPVHEHCRPTHPQCSVAQIPGDVISGPGLTIHTDRSRRHDASRHPRAQH